MQITKTMGGTMVIRNQVVPCRETWTFEDRQGTAVVQIGVEQCPEEQIRLNRQRIQKALDQMARSRH